MKKKRYIRLYDVHSWSGVTLGLFIYVVSFTGCIALFYDELRTWEDSANRIETAEEPVLIMPIVESWVADTALVKKVESVKFSYPDNHSPYFKATMVASSKDTKKVTYERRWNPNDGGVLIAKHSGLTDWLKDFHSHLMWPLELGGDKLGRFFVGLSGMILILSIITGIITHTKIIKQMFVLRTERSSLLKWQDLHKVLGLWALPFHTMIAFTGAFIGIISLLSPVVGLVAFKGDTGSLVAEIFGTQPQAIGIEAPMYSFDQVGDLRLPSNRQVPKDIVVQHWGDEGATYKVSFRSTEAIVPVDTQTISGVTGELISEELSSELPLAKRITLTLAPMHYGQFGGIGLKLVYLTLGLILCFVTASGLIVWLKRRSSVSKEPHQTIRYRRIGRFVIGVTLGLPISIMALFYLDKLYTGAESARMFSTGITYFIVWFGVILYAFIKENEQRTITQLLFVLAVLTAGIPLVNFLTTGDAFWFALGSQKSWVWVDLLCLLSGLTIAVIAAMSLKKNPK